VEEAPELERARIWLFSFLASAANCSFCNWAAVLGGGAVVMDVLATLLPGGCLGGGRWGSATQRPS
jgi:hypothetical protein